MGAGGMGDATCYSSLKLTAAVADGEVIAEGVQVAGVHLSRKRSTQLAYTQR